MRENKPKKRGFYYYFFIRTYPPWLYTVAMVLFALSIFIWIKFFLTNSYSF